MHGFAIIFEICPTGDLSQEHMEAQRRERVQDLVGFLLAHDLPFQFYKEWTHPYTTLIVLTKCFYSDQVDQIKQRLEGMDAVSIKEQEVCERSGCYEEIAGKDLHYPLMDKYGEDLHAIHRYCGAHLALTSLKILETLETLTIASGDHWICIHVWRFWERWVAQRVSQKWDRGDFRPGLSSPYLDATPWLVASTKDAAIALARAYRN